MAVPDLSLRLRGQLGPEASEDLSDAFEELQNDMLAITNDRFEARLDARLRVLATQVVTDIARTQAELRQEIAYSNSALRVAIVEGMSRISAEIAETRIDVLRWSFVFWLGQVVATATLLAFMLRSR